MDVRTHLADALRRAAAAAGVLDSDVAALRAHLTPRATSRVLPKGVPLETPGTVAAHVHFLHRGSLLQAYPTHGRRRTTYVWTAGDVVARAGSLLSGRPDRNGVYAAAAATEVLSWAWAPLRDFLRAAPERAPLLQAFTAGALVAVCDVTAVKTLPTARARYEALLAARPDWCAAVPQTEIASLLGVRRETVSRIRADIARGG